MTVASHDRDRFCLLTTAVVACVLSFIPVYVFGNNSGGNVNDEMLDLNLREACMAALFVVLGPAFDSVTELLPLLIPRSKEETVVDSMLCMTLSFAEKSIFVVGIVCLSVLYPTFQHFNSEFIVRISASFLNCSITLMVCAIFCFLLRQSTSFTLWTTRIMVALVCASGTISSCTLLYGENIISPQARVLFNVSNVLFDVAALVYMATCLNSLYRWLRRNICAARRRIKVDDVNGVDNNIDDVSQSEKDGSIEEKAIKQLVVGTHMFSTFVVMIVHGVSRWYTPSFTAYQLSIIIYIMIATALVVFVTDTFARRRITGAALLALLDAKTNYINYISHEIRTPLSATLMGLRLMLNDFKKSNPRPGSVDADRYDTLQDVNASCVASLDILNDLLCFNKLESG